MRYDIFLGSALLAASLGCGVNPGSEAKAGPAPLAETAPLEVTAADLGPKIGEEPERGVLNLRVLQRFTPLRESFKKPGKTPAALVDLGRILYYDPRLSKNGRVSCNSCHPLDKYGTTSDATPVGVEGKHMTRNAPSTYNAAAQFAQFWDGRSPSIETQPLASLANPLEMGTSETALAATVNSIPGYARLFQTAFPKDRRPVSMKNAGIAIGAFERGLATPSRWDNFLRGNLAALSGKEKEGLRIFTSIGCMVCHTGELVGGSMYEKLGAAVAWKGGDAGRAGVTHDAADSMVFKVPSLRNVARTAPYLHDGSIAGLEETVRAMGTLQLGEPLSQAEVVSIVAWLNALTGEIPARYIARPLLPGSQRKSLAALQ